MSASVTCQTVVSTVIRPDGTVSTKTTTSSPDNPAPPDLTVAVQALFDEDFGWQLRDNPEFASQTGRHEHSDKLQDVSPEAFESRRAYLSATLTRAVELRQRLGSLAASASIDRAAEELDLFIDSVAGEAAALDSGLHLFPINSIGYGGVHHNFLEALDWLPLGDEGQRCFVARLEAYPTQIAQFERLLRSGVSAKRVATRAMLRKVPEQMAEITAKISTAGSDSPVQTRIAELPDGELRGRGAAAAAAVVVALGRLSEYLSTEYIPVARPDPGCGGLPDGIGADVYAQCLRFHTTTDFDAKAVHQIGLDQVARISARYQRDVLDPLEFDGTFADFVKQCQDPAADNYFHSVDELLTAYRRLCGQIEEVLPKFFPKLPQSPLEIVAKESPTAPAAYYMAGTADGTRPGRFYVNVANLTRTPKHEMVALALHEAVPGHHLQMALTIEAAGVAPFLQFVEDRRYEYCPARRQLYAAFIEGWALYCEALGEEMGVYPDPMSLFGRLQMEMMRAVRLVVDTGIHTMGWSVERAIEYMMEQTGQSRHECEAECFRYEAWPGQATAYKIGEVAIWRMRREAEAALGDRFDLRAFHGMVLETGPTSLSVLAAKVSRWVKGQLLKTV